MPEPLLAARDLNVFYGDFQALFDVSVAVEPGEVVAVIGANGAGKSTLMRALTGLLPAASGSVLWKGAALNRMRADRFARLGIAMVPEGRQLFASLSVEENLVIGGQAGRSGLWSLERVFELFPVLKERRDSRSTALSGGQQQMVAIGRALMANPEILLFDEISLGLAPIVIKSIYDSLPEIIEEGMSAVIVEQDVTKALSVSDRVYCLQEGRVSLQSAADTVTRDAISAAYFGL